MADVLYGVLTAPVSQRVLGANTVADSCLMLLAVNFVSLGLGPADIDANHASRLRGIAASAPTAAPGVQALLAAYATVPDARHRLPNGDVAGSEWWTRSTGRRVVWSMLLGSIGRWYDAQGTDSTAVAYYEAALALPWRFNDAPIWMDIDLIFPLAVLYSQPEAMRADPARLERFLNGVFGGKSIAIASQDLPRLRRFHTALGAFFASRGEWAGGARGAIYQLESMRTVTRQLNAANPQQEPLHDSIDLLGQLLVGYCKTGATTKVVALSRDIADEAQRVGRAPSSGPPCAPATSPPR